MRKRMLEYFIIPEDFFVEKKRVELESEEIKGKSNLGYTLVIQ